MNGVLEGLGLSNAESKVYLALLKLGLSKSGKIIDKTKLQSSTVYHVFGSLIEKGLISYIIKGKIKYYQAEKPETFIHFLEEKKRKFEELLPELKAIENSGKQKQTARVYEGINGLKTAFNDILVSMKKGEDYYFFSAPKKKLFDKKIVLFFRNYHLKRAEKGIKVKGLSLLDCKDKINQIFKGIKLTQIKFIDDFAPSGIIVYKNKLITLDWEDIPTAFVIESKAVADSYKRFFEEKWKIAK